MPVWNGLTDEWHPTQMLCDVLTMREHCRKHDDEIAFAYCGDARNNVGNSLLVTGAMLGMDVRIVAPAVAAGPTTTVIDEAPAIAESTGARITLTDDVAEGVRGVDFVYTDVWVSMGEPKEVWDERIAAAAALPGQRGRCSAPTGNPDVKFMHCLPAFHDRDTDGRRASSTSRPAWTALEVTDEVFESPALDRLRPGREPDAHHQGRHGRDAGRLTDAHRRRARRQRAAAARRAAGRRRSSSANVGRGRARALAPLAAEHELVITHGNGPQVGLLALESAADPQLERPYPFDVLGAQTQGMIGYWLRAGAAERAAGPRRSPPSSTRPWSSAGGPGVRRARRSSSARSTTRRRRSGWRPSAAGSVKRRRRRLAAGRRLAAAAARRRDSADPAAPATGAVVVCAGGGGVPVVRDERRQAARGRGRRRQGPRRRGARRGPRGRRAAAAHRRPDVVRGYGTPDAAPIPRATPAALRREDFPAGSMGPKVEAVCRFVEVTGDMAAIGALEDAPLILEGKAGTVVTPGGDYGGPDDLRPRH